MSRMSLMSSASSRCWRRPGSTSSRSSAGSRRPRARTALPCGMSPGARPFQHLARGFAADRPGASAARSAAAAATAQRLADSGAPSLASSYILRELRERPADYRPGYLVHEFMHAGWQPLYVTELRRDLKEIGLAPVGSALLAENFDRWVLGPRARAAVSSIADPDRRELVRDFCIDQRFRCDVFSRDAAPLDEAEQRRRLLTAGRGVAP